MKFDFGTNQAGYKSINYKINWALDTCAKPNTNVENLNDFKEARQVINKIKQQFKK